MSYELSFSESFFSGDADGIGETDIRALYPVSKRPQCVMQALVSDEYYCPRVFRRMVKEVLGYSLPEVAFEKSGGHTPPELLVDESVHWDLLEKIRQHNTCNTLTPPIRVYLNDEHYVTVYEDKEKEVA